MAASPTGHVAINISSQPCASGANIEMCAVTPRCRTVHLNVTTLPVCPYSMIMLIPIVCMYLGVFTRLQGMILSSFMLWEACMLRCTLCRRMVWSERLNAARYAWQQILWFVVHLGSLVQVAGGVGCLGPCQSPTSADRVVTWHALSGSM